MANQGQILKQINQQNGILYGTKKEQAGDKHKDLKVQRKETNVHISTGTDGRELSGH